MQPTQTSYHIFTLTLLEIFTARRYASAVYAVVLCPSVTSRHCTKTAVCSISQTAPYHSPGTLVFRCQKSRRNSNGATPYKGAKQRWWFLINNSLHLRNGATLGRSYYGTLIRTRMRSIEWCYFQWPWVTPKYPIFRIFVVGRDRDPKLVIPTESPNRTPNGGGSRLKSAILVQYIAIF